VNALAASNLPVTGATKALRPRPSDFPAALAPEDRRTLDEVARAHVRSVLVSCRGNQTNAARALGVDRKTLARKMQRWGIAITQELRTLRPGSLVAIEGLDGAGITTQASRLVAFLNARGHRAIQTAEPSAGDIGELIRRRLASTTGLGVPGTLRTMSLLFAADRLDHFHRVVAPALAEGTTVVSDRWYHSSLAYQRTGVERDWIMALNRYTRTPDVTLFLEVRPEVGATRREGAGRRRELFHDATIQHDAATGYRITLGELRAAGERIDVINGEESPDVVFTAVLHALGLERRRQPR
jgi:dTMP kinase